MGIMKRRPVIYYRTDRGIVVAIDKMEVSHLMNAIAHHRKQVDVLEDVLQGYSGDLTFIKQRIADLEGTIEELSLELAERDPVNDPERHPKRITSGGRTDRYDPRDQYGLWGDME